MSNNKCKFYDEDNHELKTEEFKEAINNNISFSHLACAAYIRDWNSTQSRKDILDLFFKKHHEEKSAQYCCYKLRDGVYVISEKYFESMNNRAEPNLMYFAFIPDVNPRANDQLMYNRGFSTFDRAAIFALAYANYDEEDDFVRYLPSVFKLLSIKGM